MDVKVAIINRDKNTELINGFKDYIKDHGELISLEDDNVNLYVMRYFIVQLIIL